MGRSGRVLSLAIMAALLAGPSAATAQWGDLHVTPKVERWYTGGARPSPDYCFGIFLGDRGYDSVTLARDIDGDGFDDGTYPMNIEEFGSDWNPTRIAFPSVAELNDFAAHSWQLTIARSGKDDSVYRFKYGALEETDFPEIPTVLTPIPYESIVGDYTFTWTHTSRPGETCYAEVIKAQWITSTWALLAASDRTWDATGIPAGDGQFYLEYTLLTNGRLTDWAHISGEDVVVGHGETARSAEGLPITPEPTTLWLLALGAVALLRRRSV